MDSALLTAPGSDVLAHGAQDAKLFFAVTGALLDASITSWAMKRVYGSVRPITAIHYLYADNAVRLDRRGWQCAALGIVSRTAYKPPQQRQAGPWMCRRAGAGVGRAAPGHAHHPRRHLGALPAVRHHHALLPQLHQRALHILGGRRAGAAPPLCRALDQALS